jgi:hypothetical protein
MKCKLCDKEIQKVFNHKLMNTYDVDYFFCDSCCFIQTENPYWLKESYLNPIASIDTGIVKRNTLFTRRSSVILYFLFDKKKSFLDYGGGNGLFVRMMRDIGFNFYWHDKYTENTMAKGFNLKDRVDEIELVTSFECFEHFVNPIEEISKLIQKSNNILFSTKLFNGYPPDPENWWYYNFEAGQHISLYSIKSLQIIANKFNLNLASDNRGFHLLSNKKVNNTIFNMLIKISHLGLYTIIKFLMNSKTESDMKYLKQIPTGGNI